MATKKTTAADPKAKAAKTQDPKAATDQQATEDHGNVRAKGRVDDPDKQGFFGDYSNGAYANRPE